MQQSQGLMENQQSLENMYSKAKKEQLLTQKELDEFKIKVGKAVADHDAMKTKIKEQEDHFAEMDLLYRQRLNTQLTATD